MTIIPSTTTPTTDPSPKPMSRVHLAANIAGHRAALGLPAYRGLPALLLGGLPRVPLLARQVNGVLTGRTTMPYGGGTR